MIVGKGACSSFSTFPPRSFDPPCSLHAKSRGSPAVMADGTAYVWGFHGFGALGIGRTPKSLFGMSGHEENVAKRPRLLNGPWGLVGQKVASVVCGPAHTLVVTDGALAFACGQTQGDGRLGVTAAGLSSQPGLPDLHQV